MTTVEPRMTRWWRGSLLGSLALVVTPTHALEVRVVDPDGQAAPGVSVVSSDVRGSVRSAVTNERGIAVIDDLAAGNYRVLGLPQGRSPWFARYFGDAALRCDAAAVTADADIDLMLLRGGDIAGTLLDTLGEPVIGASVTALPTTDAVVSRSATTDDDGSFEVRGLDPAVTWWLEVRVVGQPTQLIGPAYDATLAAELTVEPGRVLSLGTRQLLPGATLRGVVRGPDGPIAGASVFGWTTGAVIGTTTDDEGQYTLRGLRPGDALVWSSAEGHGATWFPNLDRPGARFLTLEGAVVPSIDLQMPLGASLDGTLDGEGDRSGVAVLATNDDRTVGFSGVVDETGAFSVGRLPSGRFGLLFYAADAGLVDGPWRDNSGGEIPLDLVEGQALSLGRVTLPPGATVRGLVTGTSDGAPIYGARIIATAVEGPGDEGSGAPVTARVVTGTNRDGVYELKGLEAGTWRLSARVIPLCPNDPGWVQVYYRQAINPALQSGVTASAGQVINWDVSLPPDNDHDGMDDDWEREVGLDPTRDDSGEDPDGDGYTNLEEYLLGTDPFSPAGARACGCATGASMGGGPLGWLTLGFGLLSMRARRRLWLT